VTGVEAPQAERSRRRLSGTVEWVVIVVAAVLAAFLVRTFIFESYVVPTGSMVPTIRVHDHIIVDKLSYDIGSPQVGQIVVFHRVPADRGPGPPDLVKRIIGLPGQWLRSGPHGEIFVNGKLLDQPWLTAKDRRYPGPRICSDVLGLTAPPATADCHGGAFHVPPGAYYVMGDNRGPSFDSRYWGTVSGHLLVGRVIARIWPLRQLKWF
jgi:signal peptidase I